MSKRSLWRLLLTLVVCAGCAFFFTPLKKVRLGLDLQGGVHFELEVQGHEALEAHARDTRDRLEDKLRAAAITGVSVKAEGPLVILDGLQDSQRASFDKVLKDSISGYDLKVEGTQATLTLKDVKANEIKDDANKRALQIIENRINQFGVSEPEITATGDEGNRIVVELPGVEEGDRERIKGLLSSPGRLELRLTAPMKQPGGSFSTREAAMEFYKGQLPPGYELLPEPESDRSARAAGKTKAKNVKGEEHFVRWWLVQSRVDVNGTQITDARRSSNDLGAHTVSFQLNRDGADAFATATGTAANEERYLAIVLDRKVVSAPTVHEKIVGGSVQITGSFTSDEADDLALSLRSGAMRASMKFLEEHAVGASLGEDSIKSGVFSAALGFLVILVFMVFFYHWSGMNAIIALTVNVIVMLGLLGSFRAVITLPGIAGFALTIGMAVDANILIFERIKEELAAGRSVAAAIDAGFDRVFWTIVDSHVTQLAAALLLFLFGTGPVKGFAVSLAVGVVASLFTSIYISRYIYDWVLERHPGTKTLSVGSHSFFKGAKFDFMKYKGTALAVSWGLILVCVALVRPWKIADNPRIKLGMQFVGGNDMTVRFTKDVDQGKLRSALAAAGFPDASVVAYEKGEGGTQDYAVKVKAAKGGDQKDSSAQATVLKGIFRTLDPEASASPLPALNLEGSKGLFDHFTQANPLNAPTTEEGLKAAYQAQADLVIGTRDRLRAGLYRTFDELPGGLNPVLKAEIQKSYRLGGVVIRKNESFSPSISGEWTSKTLTAVALATAAILLYVMLRFTMSFAVGGIVALIHDVLMALALFAVFGYEFNVPVVASFLTLMGYSMADTIVVFDRIRENSHKPEYRRATITQLVNDSINQTLSRTILTSCSVLFVSVCLWLWGGPALKDLAFPLVVGVITGTYSSIYIASPVVVYWEKWFPPKDKLKQKHA